MFGTDTKATKGKYHYLFTCANDDLVHGCIIGQLGFDELTDAIRILLL